MRNVFLWVVQILLALVMLLTGGFKLVQSREKLDDSMKWVNSFTPTQIRGIGVRAGSAGSDRAGGPGRRRHRADVDAHRCRRCGPASDRCREPTRQFRPHANRGDNLTGPTPYQDADRAAGPENAR
ncbi:DoxX family protein [Streptomyces rubrogriseus]|uniref:DoxX family protein n=1 Tax=Streptomyces rubrogriseus TaxID=194673 RepID=UPI00131EF9F9|nr:DoxX family protein [Streptomyces rubrogriseus]